MRDTAKMRPPGHPLRWTSVALVLRATLAQSDFASQRCPHVGALLFILCLVLGCSHSEKGDGAFPDSGDDVCVDSSLDGGKQQTSDCLPTCKLPAGRVCEADWVCDPGELCFLSYDPDYWGGNWRGVCSVPCPETCCPQGWSCQENGRCLPDDEPVICDYEAPDAFAPTSICGSPLDDCVPAGVVGETSITAGETSDGWDVLKIILDDDNGTFAIPVPKGTVNPFEIGMMVQPGGEEGSIEFRSEDNQLLAAMVYTEGMYNLIEDLKVYFELGKPVCAPVPLLENNNGGYRVLDNLDIAEGDTVLASLPPGESADLKLEGNVYKIANVRSIQELCDCDCDPLCGAINVLIVRQ